MTDILNPSSDVQDLSCKEAARLLSYCRDRALTDVEARDLDWHLSECVNCQNFNQQLDVLAELARRFGQG